ncbi:ATP-binding protein, partial [Acinetobacter baumannii]
LANYVTHRRVIIDLLQKTIGLLDDGKYAREEMIHELIMPMQKDSSEVFLDSCNLWLIDERLAFHNYLASDKTINAMPISDSASGKE